MFALCTYMLPYITNIYFKVKNKNQQIDNNPRWTRVFLHEILSNLTFVLNFIFSGIEKITKIWYQFDLSIYNFCHVSHLPIIFPRTNKLR